MTPGAASPRGEGFDDDAIVGRAFRISLIVIAAIATAAAALVYFGGRGEDLAVVEEKPLVLPREQSREERVPAVRFSDVSEAAGIDFVPRNGATGEKLLPETMGGGCAFFDWDGDGDQDLLVVGGSAWPHDAVGRRAETGPSSRLYRNDGKGRFTDVTSAVGLPRLYGMGVAIGDYDDDGDPDVFLSGVGAQHLLRNDGGLFVDVTAEAGVGAEAGAWSTGCGFFDYDRDGDLDLFVCNYVRWSREIDFEVDYRLTGVGRAYGPPTHYPGADSCLYRNEGEGRFVEVGASSGIQVRHPATGQPVGKALAIGIVDVDEDGWIDVFVANDTVRNFLFHNQGNGKFLEIGTESGVGFDGDGKPTGAMGVDTAHFRDGRALGVAVGNFAGEMTSLYVSQGRALQFADEAISEGIGPTSRLMLSFGLFFFDYDLDGRLDLFQTNGHLEEEINKVQPSQHYRQPSQLFWNAGPDHPRCFVPVDNETTGDLATPVVGRGSAYADIDGDGDLDIVITQVGQRPLLLRNDQDLGHHYLRLRLVGSHGNRDAIGARIEVTVDGRRLRRQVMPTRSYLSQVELPVTIGLGRSTEVEDLVIHWPDGSRQEVPEVAIDTTVILRQLP
jgi:hypothetical protein